MTDRQTLLRDIDRFLKRHQMASSRFGELAVRDTAFVSRVRSGREPRSVTVKRVYLCMRRFNPNAAGTNAVKR